MNHMLNENDISFHIETCGEYLTVQTMFTLISLGLLQAEVAHFK